MDKSLVTSKFSIIIYCDGGLANRINCLINGLVLARRFDVEYKVYWPINRYCEVGLDELIDVPFPVVNEGKAAIKLLGETGIVADDNFILAPEKYWINPRKANSYDFTLSGVRNLFCFVDVVLVFFPMPNYEFRGDFLSILRELLGCRIFAFVNLDHEIKHLGLQYPYWGLHMRGTDARKSTSYYIFFRKLASLLPGRVYLATDDSDLQKFFSHSTNILYRKHGVKVGKTSISSDWIYKSLDENGELLPYNVRRTRDCVLDAIVDLLLLSRSSLILTSSSTYLELAANISNKKFSFVRAFFYAKYIFRVFLNRYK